MVSIFCIFIEVKNKLKFFVYLLNLKISFAKILVSFLLVIFHFNGFNQSIKSLILGHDPVLFCSFVVCLRIF